MKKFIFALLLCVIGNAIAAENDKNVMMLGKGGRDAYLSGSITPQIEHPPMIAPIASQDNIIKANQALMNSQNGLINQSSDAINTSSSSDIVNIDPKSSKNYLYSYDTEENIAQCQKDLISLNNNLQLLSSKQETLANLINSEYWINAGIPEKQQIIKVLVDIYKMPSNQLEEAKKKIISKYAIECKNKIIQNNP